MSTAASQAGILIVDDMEENLVAFEAVLGPLHQRLVRARSGEEALKAMLREDFAVVLLDVLMPGMDGFETAANIKRLDQTKDVPIILVTGIDPDADYAYRGYAVGAADFLSKPIDPWLLRTKVNVFLELHRKNRQLTEQAEQLRRLLDSERESAQTAQTVQNAQNAGDETRLRQITESLARIEGSARDPDGTDTRELADRIAEVRRSLGSLVAGT